ncbi:hypothetical protein GPALN_004218 [Globodera pallida]|nr:hypothetical protein GPALN_004218 [Globodera pallida]
MEDASNNDMASLNGKTLVNVNKWPAIPLKHRPHESTKLDNHPTDNYEPADNSARPNNSANVDSNLASSNNTRKSRSNQHTNNATATTNPHVDDHNFKAYNSKTARHDKPLITSQQITFRRRWGFDNSSNRRNATNRYDYHGSQWRKASFFQVQEQRRNNQHDTKGNQHRPFNWTSSHRRPNFRATPNGETIQTKRQSQTLRDSQQQVKQRTETSPTDLPPMET